MDIDRHGYVVRLSEFCQYQILPLPFILSRLVELQTNYTDEHYIKIS